MSSVVALRENAAADTQTPLCLDALESEEQVVLWILRNWISGNSRWSRIWAGVTSYLGEDDSPDALRAFGDLMLCLKFNGRHSFCAGAPGCPVTPDELAILSLVAGHQAQKDQFTDSLCKWLVAPSAQQVLLSSSRTFAQLLKRHRVVLPHRCASDNTELLAAS